MRVRNLPLTLIALDVRVVAKSRKLLREDMRISARQDALVSLLAMADRPVAAV
jgi:hypothetical protein